MVFNNGTTDSMTTSVLSSIKWKIHFGVTIGVCQETPAFSAVVPDGDKDSGEFYIKSSPLAGEQKTTIAWYRDESEINFKIIEITRPQ
ncbi:MAG: hypothetical protein HC815_05705 [Richelia sp. RM1_1_1]|nr:hypothetical protein [Richelia sp. RM1_1_1]